MMLPLIMAVYSRVQRRRALIARLQRRDPQALAELYDRYGRMALFAGSASGARRIRSRRIWFRKRFCACGTGSNPSTRRKDALGPWLLAIARNRAIDYLRSSAGRDRKRGGTG